MALVCHATLQAGRRKLLISGGVVFNICGPLPDGWRRSIVNTELYPRIDIIPILGFIWICTKLGVHLGAVYTDCMHSDPCSALDNVGSFDEIRAGLRQIFKWKEGSYP